jgi:hypothetical protein
MGDPGAFCKSPSASHSGGPARTLRRVPRRPDRIFAALVVCVYLPVAIFAIAHHEMWRDELHCWLVARDSPTPWDVVRNRAYDGQPPLWYLLLWLLRRVTHDVRAMQIVHVTIATTVVWVFASRAPFGRPLRAIFPFGYFLAYEYVALSRGYGLALLLALLLCVNHPRRLERPVRTALLLGALALTTTVSTVVAAAYTAVLVVDAVRLVRRRDPTTWRALVPIAVGAAAFVAAALCAWPPGDSTVAHVGWPHEMPDDFAPTRLLVALFPIPRPYFYFWNSNALLSFEPFRPIAVPVALALATWILFVLSRRREAALLFAAGVLGLMVLFGLVYGGDVRHHGFLFVLLLMGAWLANETPGPAHASGPRWKYLRAAALVPTVAVVLVAHVAGTPIALAYEYAKVFSSGRRAADVLRSLSLTGAPLVAEFDYPATAILGQLGDDAFATSPRAGRPFSFVKWTRDRAWAPTDQQTLHFAAGFGASRGEDAVLLMNRPLLPELVDGKDVVSLAELYDSMIEEENFYIYRVARNTASAFGVQPVPP